MIKKYIRPLFLIFTISVISLWQIWEQDLFWLLKCGEYLVEKGKWLCYEPWSPTANMQYWADAFHLTERLLFYTHNSFGIPGLIFLRSLLLFNLFFGLYLLIQKEVENIERNPFLLLFLLFSLVYWLIFYRIQLRPDFFVLSLAPYLIYIWQNIYFKKALFYSNIVLFLAVNLHAGAAFNLFFLQVFFSLQLKNKITSFLSVLTSGLVMLLSPIHWKAYAITFSVLNNQFNLNLKNDDWYSIVDWLQVNNSLVQFQLILLLIFSSAIFYYFISSYKNHTLRKWELLFSLFLFALSLYMFRAFSYFVLFCAPYFLITIAKIPSKKSYLYWTLLVSCWFYFYNSFPYKYGLKVNDQFYPVYAKEKLKQIPQLNLLHEPAEGAYLLWELPAFSSYIDTRQVIFNGFAKELMKAKTHPVKFQAFLDKYKINTLLLRRPMALKTGSANNEFIMNTFDKKEWGLTYFDNEYFILQKRNDYPNEKYFKYFQIDYWLLTALDEMQFNQDYDDIKLCFSQIAVPRVCHLTKVFSKGAGFTEEDMVYELKQLMNHDKGLKSEVQSLLLPLEEMGRDQELEVIYKALDINEI